MINSLEHAFTMANERAKEAMLADGSKNTKLAYQRSVRHFLNWAKTWYPSLAEGRLTDHLPLQLGVIENYQNYCLDFERTKESIATVKLRIATLSSLHTKAIEAKTIPPYNPCREEVIKLRFVREQKLRAQKNELKKPKDPITRNILDRVLKRLDDSPRDVMFKALLLFTFCSGGRRASEPCFAKIENLREQTEDGVTGYVYLMTNSKTNKTGVVEKKIILGRNGEAYLALKRWLNIRPQKSVYIFPSFKPGKLDTPVNRTSLWARLKRLIAEIGEDPTCYTFHGLRSGYCTDAAATNVPIATIKHRTGHHSTKIFEQYVREKIDFNCPSLNL